MNPFAGTRVTLPEDRIRFYRRLAEEQAARSLIRELEVPAQTGRAFVVEKGQILRIACTAGPQVADFNAFNRDDPRQMFWSGRTRVIQGAHLTVGNRLWSTPPKMEPMFTIIADTVDHRPLPHGARSHDLLYPRCNAKLYELVTGIAGLPNCQDNLAHAIAEFSLTPDYVHDCFNILMTTGRNDADGLFHLEPDAKRNDYVELFAEVDRIVALSACPAGSSAQPVASPTTGHFPLGVRIYQASI